MANTRSEETRAPLARLSFANLFETKEKVDDKGNKKHTYDATLLFPKSTDLTALKNMAFATAEKEWPGKAQQWIKDGLIKHPFLDGDGPQGLSKKTGERYAGYEGMTFIRCSTTLKPTVVDRNVVPIVNKDEIYSGCWGYPVVSFYTWTNEKGGKGISAGISFFQKVKDDDRLGGGAGDPSKHFEPIPDDGEKPDVGAGGAADMFA